MTRFTVAASHVSHLTRLSDTERLRVEFTDGLGRNPSRSGFLSQSQVEPEPRRELTLLVGCGDSKQL